MSESSIESRTKRGWSIGFGLERLGFLTLRFPLVMAVVVLVERDRSARPDREAFRVTMLPAKKARPPLPPGSPPLTET